jgi:hypothetical protein
MKERGFICQSCHMPEMQRPVATDGPIRQGRQHLWRGGHDPEMIKRAVAIQMVANPSEPKPGENVEVTLTLINAGAGHKLPTGDPDRHFTVEFMVEDRNQRTLESQKDTMGRWIMWQPAIVELYDNRLMPLASRDYTFTYRLPKELEGLRLKARVRYHIQSERQHEMLVKKYGLTANDPYWFTIYEREVPLTGNLTASLSDGPDPRLGCAAPQASGDKQG